MSRATYLVLGLLLLIVAGAVWIYTRPAVPIPLPEPAHEIEPPAPTSTQQVIGQSVEGRAIEAFTFGTGTTNLLFIGGIHGGYEWNSILLAYEMIDYYAAHFEEIPENVTVHIIPNLNPDGLYAATQLEGKFAATDIRNNDMHQTGVGRFNAHNVDINRNFDCKWQPTSTWRGNIVAAGTQAFSEPEAETLRAYVTQYIPTGVVFWHSKADNVYGSECKEGILPGTLTLMNTYATAGGYGAVPSFDAYPVTGDAEGWLASIGIPAVTVELGSRTSTEWEQNKAAMDAVLQLYTE